MLRYLAPLAISLTLLSCSGGKSNNQSDIELKSKIAQMVAVGFENEKDILQQIQNGCIGGVFFQKYENKKGNIINTEQTKKIISLIINSSNNNLKPLIMTTREGGSMDDMSKITKIKKFPSQAKLAEINDEEFLKIISSVGNEMKEIGFNVNLSPNLEINKNSSSYTARSERYFGLGPVSVYKNSHRYIKAMHKSGMITAIRYFPGYGGVLEEYSRTNPVILQNWSIEESYPYIRLIGINGYDDIIITSNAINQFIDRENPVSLSSEAIDWFLRKKIGYDGVVMTEFIDTNGLQGMELKKILTLSINAGVDIISHTGNNHKNIGCMINKEIFDLVKTGNITRGRIDKSYRRIKRLKYRYNLGKEGF